MTSRVLITGAAGNLGTKLRSRLAHPGRLLRLLDIADLPEPAADEAAELWPGSITDLPTMLAACAGVDAVIHLGGHSRERTWQDILDVNIAGTYNVFEAARRQGVERVIYASSIHAAGYAPSTTAEAPDWLYPRPDTNYGVGKVAGEAIGSLYADRYGLNVICVRIGVSFEKPTRPRTLGAWLSPDDCGRLFEACLTTPSPGYRIIWGVSANTRRTLSLTEARRLGYHPEYDSEECAAEAIARHGELSPDDPAARYLGADWCTPDFDTARIEAEQEG